MTINGWIQILVFLGIVIALVKPLGGYITRVMNGERTFLSPVLGPVERGLYGMAGTSEKEEQHWTTYLGAMLLFNLAGFALLYLLQRVQGGLPFNPAGMGAVSADSSFNTAVSFMTNTNWQGYGGETTMSYLTQMAGITVQNFVSAAVGVAGAMAIIRGFSRASAKTVGNFWVDLTRATLYILMPICIVGSLVLVWQGVPQNLNPYTVATTVEGAQQTIAQGPVASQMIIKHLGTNGGGFFNANSSHPFENPTALTNLIHILAIYSISFAMLNVFGRMIGNQKQGWALLAAVLTIVIAGIGVIYWAESAGNPLLHALGLEGGNMEGKETRFGIALSSLFSVVTTSASTGAVNNMHDSLMPLGGLVPLFNMQIPPLGGIGAGVYGTLIFAILAVFIAGLMVGRTPEYIGKKIEAKEIKMSILAMLGPSLAILALTAIAVVLPVGLSSIQDAGPHGLSEILYAYTSGSNNNGSAFAGLRTYALPHFGSTKIEKIGSKEFEAFWIWRKSNFSKKQPSNGTLGREKNAIVPLFKYAVSKGYISSVPAMSLPKAKHTRRPTFTLKEYQTLIRKLRPWVKESEGKANWRDRYVFQQVFLILANSGLRVGELRGLCWGDLRTVETEDGPRMVGYAKGKTGAREFVFMPSGPTYIQRLKSLRKKELENDPPSDGLVVCHRDGKKILSFKRAFKAILEYAKIPEERDGMARTIYSLRHFYATQRLSHETNPFLLAKQMGTSVEMLEKFYGQTVTSDLARQLTKGGLGIR